MLMDSKIFHWFVFFINSVTERLAGDVAAPAAGLDGVVDVARVGGVGAGRRAGLRRGGAHLGQRHRRRLLALLPLRRR